ncbi:MAG: STAS domain-containing protein [Gammaproteobacteria bacterium]|nr:STAS domain-containing protein [Gammaproteobacteria bacterium]MCP5423771.1 STAS domain-containing protein [Gammaproteobacteria bacterium]
MTASLEPVGEGRFKVAGELSFATVNTLWQQGAQLFAPHSALLVDLQGVTRADSAGVALLVEWLRQARLRSQILQFAHIPPQMRSIIAIADLDRVLPVCSDIVTDIQ